MKDKVMGATLVIVGMPTVALVTVMALLFSVVTSDKGADDTAANQTCGSGAVKIPAKAKPWIAETSKVSGIPQAWLAAVANRESHFDASPADYTYDHNGGTWGIYQLNREIWESVYPPSKGSTGTPKDITNPTVYAHYAGIYFKQRLAGVREMKKHSPDKPFAKLPDLDLLVLAHNAGEGGGVLAYPNIAPVTQSYLAEVRRNFTAKPCSSSTTSGSNGKYGVDTYLSYWNSHGHPNGGADPQAFFWGQCVSYAAFMVRTTTGYKDFTNFWRGQHFGNAYEWAAAARGAGIRVDQTPAVGAIAQRTTNPPGHVAYITRVNADGSFDVNEYNHAGDQRFGARKNARIGPGSDGFTNILHFEKKAATS